MKEKVLLTLIVFFGLVVRIIGIGSLPSGFNQDEASFGYDAYSILETGNDQWGNTPFPALKSFGDYKLPLYSYLAIPSVAIFGLNEFAVRLPNALLGVFALLFVYLLTRNNLNKNAAFFAAFLLAVSPWHIALSRGAFEANMASTIIPLGVLFFYKGLKNNKLFILSALVYGLGIFSYHSIRIITPLIMVFLYSTNFKKIKLKENYLAIAIFGIFAAIAAYSYIFSGGSRLATSSIIREVGLVWEGRYVSVMVGAPEFVATLFNNKYIFLVSRFISNYLQYFSTGFLFTSGAGEMTYGMVSGVGVLYLVELLFLLSFIHYLFTTKEKNNFVKLLLFWLLVAPIPAALTSGSGFSANRSAVMMPAIQIISAIGAIHFAKIVSEKYSLSFARALQVITLIILFSFLFFLETYIYRQPAHGAKQMSYGMSEVMNYISGKEHEYSEIIISKKISEPHIFVAFYNKVDPLTFQKETSKWGFDESNLDWVDQLGEYSVGKYTFKNIDWSVDLNRHDSLIIEKAPVYDERVNVINTINYPDNTPAYVIIDTRND